MKVKVLGCGNAFSTLNGNACFLLEDTQRRVLRDWSKGEDEEDSAECFKTRHMLIDAGWALPYMLKKNGIDIRHITDIYLSHQHSDHAGSLEYIGFMRYDWVNKPDHFSKFKGMNAPALIANAKLMDDLWDKTLSGGMSSVEGLDTKLETFFEPCPIRGSEKFYWCGWTCSLIQQIHIMTGSMISNTFGLFMEKDGHPSLYFVTDSQHCSPRQIEIFYKRADVIFQDCECIGVDTPNKHMKFCSGVHANYAQLAGWGGTNSVILPEEIKKKMWLTHYQDFVSEGKDFFGNSCDWNELAVEDGFKGFLKVGQEFEF
jgi:hypothetical protein